MDASLGSCQASIVIADNDAHPDYTMLQVKTKDTPGLLRVLAWVLNGMAVRVQHGALETTPEGDVLDTLWVTDFKGRKLSASAAASLASRMEDFLIMCEEGSEAEHAVQEWRCGAVEISNIAHPELTQVTIRGEPSRHKPGFLFELATALTSTGVGVHSAAIQGGPEVPPGCSPVAEPEYDFAQGRFFRFLIQGPKGGKLDADRVASLLFTLRLLGGKGAAGPTVAPNMDALLKMDTRCL